MKQLILIALLISGVFLSSKTIAQQSAAYTCPEGGTYQNHPQLGHICSEPSPSGTIYTAHAGTGHSASSSNASEALTKAVLDPAVIAQATVGGFTQPNRVVTYTYSHHVVVSQTATAISVQFYRAKSCSGGECSPSDTNLAAYSSLSANIIDTKIDNYCPPDNSPALNSFGGEKPNLFCWANATEPEPEPPCNCDDFRGDAPYSFENLIAPVGTYNNTDNMPQCMTLSRSANPSDTDAPVAQCDCQVSAKKWVRFSGPTINGVEHDRWEAYPVAQGQPSGTITGVTCAKEDATTEPTDPDAPKDCYTLKSGAKWCWADPKEKCTIVNGQEQCSSGCGYINGDFVCYEEDDPTTPDRQDEELTEPDDTITDPNKLMPDITKGDLKEINKGTETRLDNVVTSLKNNNNELKGIGEGISETNDNLDGIGRQLDGQGKTLNGIKEGIQDAFSDDGSPEGTGDGTSSWYESEYPDGLVGIWNEHSTALQETPMFDFLNQFKLTPSGSQPDLNMCLNFGALGNFGCFDIEIPSIIWAFLKICILISAAWLCRALIFGG